MKHNTNALPGNQAGSFFQGERVIWLLILFLFVERLIALWTLGPTYTLSNDDLSYVKSGIFFAQTGSITMHTTLPSAQIMPGMTWLIGLVSILFGDGICLWIALKLIWALIGSLTGWFLYQSVRLYAPRWCALVAVLPLFAADFVWADNLILTETPFTLCFTAMIYFTLRMGKSGQNRYFVGCLAAYVLALLLKANIALYPLFAMGYLLFVGYSFQRLLKQGLVLLCAVLCFLVPWSIRNYIQFDAFIPLTYGAGNPALLGTYQGVGYPHDEELDYQTNVDTVVRETYAKYYAADDSVPAKFQKYLSLQSDAVKAHYRLKVWAKKHPGSLLVSYLLIKPAQMVNSTFYWSTVFGVPGIFIQQLQYLNTFLCVCVVAASLYLKKARPQIFFLAALYFGNAFVYAFTFINGRYNISLMPARYILVAIGLSFLPRLLPARIRKKWHSVLNRGCGQTSCGREH